MKIFEKISPVQDPTLKMFLDSQRPSPHTSQLEKKSVVRVSM